MRYRIALLLVVLWLTGCGRSIFDPTFFDEYVKLFERESITYRNPQSVTNLRIQFSTELEDKIVGQCQYLETPLILVNVRWWEKLTPDEKEILLFHEMGHCILNLPHDDTHPSIMNSMLLLGYRGIRTQLLTEYFQKRVDRVNKVRYAF